MASLCECWSFYSSILQSCSFVFLGTKQSCVWHDVNLYTHRGYLIKLDQYQIDQNPTLVKQEDQMYYRKYFCDFSFQPPSSMDDTLFENVGNLCILHRKYKQGLAIWLIFLIKKMNET